jgi:guanidinobutyrase
MLSSSTKMLRRGFTTSVTSVLRKQLSEPISPHDLHRAGGISSFMRLPIAQPPKAKGDLDVAFLGIPFDTATSNRPGARFGPRHIRAESPMVRKRNHATGAQPFDTLTVADIGDVDICLYDIKYGVPLIASQSFTRIS